ncbi:hypothetical protein AAES_109819 [Amazona aestiva]|uniref:Uncharacterized protein n=1 Tax=Amazona aestiva TaxID=12930 RepID=A0A0Q3PS64_AMAAE|nr:hypothetical protein AAES_109819 [Amazona aestiva]
MVNSRRTGKARSGSSALAAPVVASVGTQTEPMGREAVVQSSGYPKGRVSNGRGYTLRSLVEALLQQVAELQEAVTRMKGVREAEGEQHCLLRDQTVPGPRVSTVAHAGKEAANPGKEAANPGSWEKRTKQRLVVFKGKFGSKETSWNCSQWTINHSAQAQLCKKKVLDGSVP